MRTSCSYRSSPLSTNTSYSVSQSEPVKCGTDGIRPDFTFTGFSGFDARLTPLFFGAGAGTLAPEPREVPPPEDDLPPPPEDPPEPLSPKPTGAIDRSSPGQS